MAMKIKWIFFFSPSDLYVNPIALRTAKTLWSFGHSECNRVKRKCKFVYVVYATANLIVRDYIGTWLSVFFKKNKKQTLGYCEEVHWFLKKCLGYNDDICYTAQGSLV